MHRGNTDESLDCEDRLMLFLQLIIYVSDWEFTKWADSANSLCPCPLSITSSLRPASEIVNAHMNTLPHKTNAGEESFLMMLFRFRCSSAD